MTITDNLTVVALLISMASLIVAIASIVMSAKNKQAGAVEPRTRAIEQIREALSDLRQNQSLTPKAIASITKAHFLDAHRTQYESVVLAPALQNLPRKGPAALTKARRPAWSASRTSLPSRALVSRAKVRCIGDGLGVTVRDCHADQPLYWPGWSAVGAGEGRPHRLLADLLAQEIHDEGIRHNE
jgi:hypothetical protein